MAQDNVEIVRRVHEEVAARLELPEELFDANWELDVTEFSVVYAGVVCGREAVEALRQHWEMFEDFRSEIEEVIHADEEQVVTAVRDSGRIRGSDAEVSNRLFHVWTFGNGRIIRLWVHTDRNRALEAARLRD